MSAPARRPPHPIVYFILYLPFGASAGFIAVTLAYVASHAGIGDASISAMTAYSTLSNTPKFLWAPLVDTVWTTKGWYIATNFLSSLTILAMGLIPMTRDNIGLLDVVIFINGIMAGFIGMTTPSLMAHLTPPEGRGAAAGWSQAGNVGGGVIGGLALLLAQRVDAAWIPAAAVATVLMACSLALIGLADPRTESPAKLGATVKALGRDLKSLLWSRVGAVAIGLCFLPIGSGAAANLFAAMADDWHASADLVSFWNGIGSGLAAMVGSVLGGRLSNAMERRRAYALSGVALAAVAWAMALVPKSPGTYVISVVTYNLAIGLCYATFTGFVLDIMGKGSAATKYNVFAALANIPIVFMGFLDGWVAETYGRDTMLWVDGASGVIGAILLLLIVFVAQPRKGTQAEPEVALAEAKVVPPAD